MKASHVIVMLLYIASLSGAMVMNLLIWIAAYQAFDHRDESAVFVLPAGITAMTMAAYGGGAIGIANWIDRGRKRSEMVRSRAWGGRL